MKSPEKKNVLLGIVPALLLYAILCWSLNFVQDDAYISYRYIENFLNGDGLVFNIGERVEGYTNHGWVILLSMFGALGLPYIGLSQIIGFLCGGGLVVLAAMIARRLIPDSHLLVQLIPSYLVAASMSLAYWSPAGLETSAFALAATASLYWYLTRSRLLVFGLAMAVWIRPEGALVAMLLLLVEAITERRLPWFSLGCGVMAFVLSLPYVVFKIVYYGSLLPNPFFAKTGWNMQQVLSGLEYTGRFFSHYPLAAVGLAVGLLLWMKLRGQGRAVVLFSLLYAVYITVVGGDVLKVHRFFLPVLAPLAVLAALAVNWVLVRVKKSQVVPGAVTLGLLAVLVTWFLPRDFVTNYNFREKAFTDRMARMADNIKASDDSNFSVALPTIGTFGYKLIGHDIIDMLGLTDSTIARHAGEEIPGMETTWKERKHNSAYLLGRAPDYIMFSTGYKPSAPAEKALFLYQPFLDAYRTIAWAYTQEGESDGTVRPVYKRVREVAGAMEPDRELAYVDQYKLGLETLTAGQYRESLTHMDAALRAAGKPLYPYLVYFKAYDHMMLQQHEIAQRLYSTVLEQDSLVFEAHRELLMYALLDGNPAAASLHERWLKRLVPWYWDRIEENMRRLVRANRTGSRE